MTVLCVFSISPRGVGKYTRVQNMYADELWIWLALTGQTLEKCMAGFDEELVKERSDGMDHGVISRYAEQRRSLQQDLLYATAVVTT